MKYRVLLYRIPDKKPIRRFNDPLYEGEFDSNEDMADDIGERAGNAISEAITVDVAARKDASQ